MGGDFLGVRSRAALWMTVHSRRARMRNEKIVPHRVPTRGKIWAVAQFECELFSNAEAQSSRRIFNLRTRLRDLRASAFQKKMVRGKLKRRLGGIARIFQECGMPNPRPLSRFAFAVALFLAATPAAFAHARLLRSSPPAGAELARPPERIELWFNELLDDGFNSITVFPAAELASQKRTNLANGKPVVDPRDRTHLTLTIESLAPGNYVIEWRVLSRDGHSAPGRSTFRILAR